MSHHAPGSSSGVPSLARKPNYDFEKRRKEQDRKAKKDAKREDRLRRRAEGLPEDDELSEPGVPAAETPAETTE
jgi:hypothetical protein